MRRLALMMAAVAAVTVVPSEVADACPGGGGGGAGGGSSGSGGGGGSGGGFTLNGGWADHVATHVASACEDTSDVVGYRRCKQFGTWGSDLRRPQITVEAGAMLRRFPSLLDGHMGSVTHGAETFAFRTVQSSSAPARALDTAVLSTMRVSAGMTSGLYGGLEVDLGGVTRPGATGTEMMSTGVFGSPDVQQSGGFIMDSVGLVGLRGRTGSGTLGVEVAGGLRAVSYDFHSSYHGCESMTGIMAFSPVAEARARGELWLSPWLTAGAMVGASVLERNAWMGGLYLGLHSRAFGGER